MKRRNCERGCRCWKREEEKRIISTKTKDYSLFDFVAYVRLLNIWNESARVVASCNLLRLEMIQDEDEQKIKLLISDVQSLKKNFQFNPAMLKFSDHSDNVQISRVWLGIFFHLASHGLNCLQVHNYFCRSTLLVHIVLQLHPSSLSLLLSDICYILFLRKFG